MLTLQSKTRGVLCSRWNYHAFTPENMPKLSLLNGGLTICWQTPMELYISLNQYPYHVLFRSITAGLHFVRPRHSTLTKLWHITSNWALLCTQEDQKNLVNVSLGSCHIQTAWAVPCFAFHCHATSVLPGLSHRTLNPVNESGPLFQAFFILIPATSPWWNATGMPAPATWH